MLAQHKHVMLATSKSKQLDAQDAASTNLC